MTPTDQVWHPDTPLDYRDAIVTGDARDLARRIPDASVDLIFTDPVYDRLNDYAWLAETAMRVLKPCGWALIYYGIGYLPQTTAAIAPYLEYVWHHINYMPTLNARGAYRTFSNYRALLRYRKGPARPYRDARDLLQDGYDARNNGHAWAKNADVVTNWMAAYSPPSAIVYDPFAGGGTVPAVCKMLGRHFIASEIDPATAEAARQRLADTQMPLLVVEPEQLGLAV